jgi:hypothetical protein
VLKAVCKRWRTYSNASVARAPWDFMRTYSELICRPPSLRSPADAGNRLSTRFRRPVATCFSGRQSNHFNNLVLILFASCARRVRTFRQAKLRQRPGAAARHPQPQAAGARPCDPAADRAGAVGSDRTDDDLLQVLTSVLTVTARRDHARRGRPDRWMPGYARAGASHG